MRALPYDWVAIDPELAAKELSLTKPNRNFHARTEGRSALRVFLPLALIATLFAALVAAPIATAQDPGYDQYEATPTPPGNDPAPNENEDPVPASGTNSGGTSDDGSTGAVPSTDSGVPPTTEPGTDPATGGNGGGKDQSGNKDDRTLEGFAASAENQRANHGLQTGTQLRSEAGANDSSGIGWFIWVALGLIIIWAIAMGVTNFRRRNGDRGNGAARRSGEQQTA